MIDPPRVVASHDRSAARRGFGLVGAFQKIFDFSQGIRGRFIASAALRAYTRCIPPLAGPEEPTMPRTNYLRSKNDICRDCGGPISAAFYLCDIDPPRCRACMASALKHGDNRVFLSREMIIAFQPNDGGNPFTVLGCEPNASPFSAVDSNDAGAWPWSFFMTGGSCSAYSLNLRTDSGLWFVVATTVDGSDAPRVGEACVVGVYRSADIFGAEDPFFLAEYPAFYPVPTRDAAAVDFAVFCDSMGM
jgi:hypothetical protein